MRGVRLLVGGAAVALAFLAAMRLVESGVGAILFAVFIAGCVVWTIFQVVRDQPGGFSYKAVAFVKVILRLMAIAAFIAFIIWINYDAGYTDEELHELHPSVQRYQ